MGASQRTAHLGVMLWGFSRHREPDEPNVPRFTIDTIKQLALTDEHWYFTFPNKICGGSNPLASWERGRVCEHPGKTLLTNNWNSRGSADTSVNFHRPKSTGQKRSREGQSDNATVSCRNSGSSCSTRMPMSPYRNRGRRLLPPSRPAAYHPGFQPHRQTRPP